MPQNKQISQALENRSRLLEDFTQGQLERINKYSECCTSARDRDRENFGWDFVGGLSTDEGRPYQNYNQYLNILRRSVGVFEDSATMQGIAAKYISYVLGKEGAKYTVEKKPAKDICSLEELTSSNRTPLTFDQSDIKKMNCIIDVVSHTANDWLSLQKDGLWEYFRTGEMIRRTSELVKEKFPEVDIVTSFQVRPPNTTRSSLPTTNRSTTKINAEYGIRFVSGRPRTYYILDEGGENPIGHPVERIQHVKFGSQKKNPRAVPPFFVVRENADGIKQYEFGIRESFLARSLNSVIWELPPASATDGTAMAFLESRGYANEDVKSEARVGLPDGGSGYTPDRSLTGEVHTTSKVVYPSPNLGADEVISLIKMEQTMIGLVVCMADYLSTGSSDTGNRATLQESGDPFTAAIIQGRTLLAKTDAELFWRILQIWFGWNENQLIAAQMQLQIKSNFSEIVKEDESKIANAASILVTANIWSKAQARRRTKVDPDQMKREIEQEKKEEPTPAQQQLQNGEQNGNGQPFQAKLDSPSEDEQTPSTPAEQVQNRRPQGTNPASPSNRSATEGLSEHNPGGRDHDQKKHGRRNAGRKLLTKEQETQIQSYPNSKVYVVDEGPAKGTAIVVAGSLHIVVRPDGTPQEVPPKFQKQTESLIQTAVEIPFPSTNKPQEVDSEPQDIRLAGQGTFQVRTRNGRPEYYDQKTDTWKKLTGNGQFQKRLLSKLREDNQSDASFPCLVEHTPGGKEHDQQTHGRNKKASEFISAKLNARIVSHDFGKNNPFSKGLGDKTDFVVGDTTIQTHIEETKDKVSLTNIQVKETSDLTKQKQGTGLGTELVNLLKKYSDDTGKTLIIVGSTKKAETFWERFGFFEKGSFSDNFKGTDYRYVPKRIRESLEEPITEEVLEEFLGEVDNTGEQVSHNTVLENLQRAGYKIPDNWQSRIGKVENVKRTEDEVTADLRLEEEDEQDSTESSDTSSETNQDHPDDEGGDQDLPGRNTGDEEAETTPEPNLQEALDMFNESLGLEDKEDCPQCQGTGLSGDDLCANCKGTGNQQKERQQDDLSTQPNTES